MPAKDLRETALTNHPERSRASHPPFSTNRTRGYGDTPPDQRCSRSELRGVGADTDLEDELHLRVRELLLGDDHRLRELDELVQREHADPVVLS